MRHTTMLIAALFLGLAASDASAQKNDAESDCTSATSTVEMNTCADGQLNAADKELNAAYKRALAAIPDAAIEDNPNFTAEAWEKALRESQRAWLKFRDAECKEHVPMFWGGGTGTTFAVLGCMIEKTKSRTAELKALYENPNR